MALSVNINLAQKQKLVVTQTLRVAIELLQISSLELKDRIEQELEENPVLELKAPENDGTTPPTTEEAAAAADTATVEERLDDDMMRMFDDSLEPEYQSKGTASRDPDSKQQFIEGALQRAETYHEHLLDQLGLAVTNEQDRTVGEILISYIN
jgi:RNA polymerase sigma-54 factor